jgi:phosphatidylglycerol:prolipoprotein diacylglycerol transferase
VGRLGNFIEGGVVGRATDVWWGFHYADLEGARHPVALYESAKNFVILPILVWALRIWPSGRGMVVSIFVLLYAGLRFAVDLFRDYEAAWLGIGTGQVFNLVMATAGLVMVIWFLRHPASATQRTDQKEPKMGWLLPTLLIILILYPLGIPTSWTQQNITEKRLEVKPESTSN